MNKERLKNGLEKTVPARPLYRHSDIEEALFADVFSGSLCRMEVAAIGIVCADSHYGGVLPFQPLFSSGPVCTGKERCRKQKAILAGAQPLNFGHEALLISFSNVRLDQTHP